MIRKQAFTLAELLITLSIVGVIATLAITPVVQNVQRTQLKIMYKSEYSRINQVTQKLLLDNGGTLIGAFNDFGEFRDKYCNYLNCIKRCGGWDTECWTVSDAAITAILPDGALLAFGVWGDVGQNVKDCNLKYGWEPEETIPRCGSITVDVNGFKKPNANGIDQFTIYIRKDKAVPDGAPGTTYYPCTETGGSSCAAEYLRQ